MNHILLDTCACLWIVAGELSEAAADILEQTLDDGQTVFVSPITALEVGNLARKGRFRSNLTPQRWFDKLLSAPGVALSAMTPSVLIESASLRGFRTNDPADRILAATAREYGYTLMTRDAALLDYGVQGYLSVLEC